MIFGLFGKGRQEDEDEDQEIELVTFQGPLNGADVDLKTNARLAQAALVPAKELVSDGLARRAETIRLEPKGDRAVTTLVVDGIAYPGSRMPKQQGMAVTQMMKLFAGLDIKERAKPQSGGLKGEYQGTPYEISVQTAPMQGGAEKLTIRLRNLKAKLNTPEDLGFSTEVKTAVRDMTAKKQGLVIVCGPPGSGTTTTLFAVARCVDAYLFNIYSMNKESTRDLYNVTQYQTEPGDDLESSIMRMTRAEADVILFDPLRDAETAKTLFKMRERASFIMEMAAKDSAHAIVQINNWVEDPALVSAGLEGVFSQKLIRLLCASCKQAYKPNPKLLAKVGLPPETKVLYRKPVAAEDERGRVIEPEPCDTCGGVGYLGRVAMIEMIGMTDAMRELVAKKPAADEIKELARKEGMQNFHKDGLRLVAEGKTSLEELQRVFKAQ